MDRTFSRYASPPTDEINFAIDDNCDVCGTNSWHRLDNSQWICDQCGSESGGDQLEDLYYDPTDRSGRALRRIRRQKTRRAKKRRAQRY